MPEIDMNVGDEVTNDELTTVFKCGPQGGMRRSLATNTLILTSKHVDNVYDDRWVGDVFHYTGMGLEGDQSLIYMQNRTLAESALNGIEVHLFEVFKPRVYTYMGVVELAGEPYAETQPDQNGLERLVYVFPIKPISGNQPILSYEKVENAVGKKQKSARRLSDEELKNRASQPSQKGASRSVQSTYYERNAWVSEYAKRLANGICQLCDTAAPFINAAGEPYLETHHIVWLSKGGEDSTANTVALCPNCHRKMHILDLKYDIQKLLNQKWPHS